MAAFWFLAFWVSFGLLAYTQVGYALLVVLLAPRRKERPEPAEWPAVTLIVPAHNEEKVLEAKLENVLALDYPRDRLQVLVASDGSEDRTNEIAASYAERGIRLLAFSPRRGKASGLNDAVDEAAHDILCLCDANVMFRPDALKVMVARLAGDDTLGAVTGDVRLAHDESNFGEGEGFYYRIEKRLQEAESELGSVMGVDGGMYVIRTSLFAKLPPDTILDDFVVSMRCLKQGKRVYYESEAVADENGTPAASQEYRRRVRVAAGAVQTLKRGEWPPARRVVELWMYLSHKLLRWLGPLWLAGLLAGSVALSATHWIYAVALWGQVAVYALFLAGLFSLRLRATSLGGICFYFVLSHVAMTVGTVKGLLNRQKVTWKQAERVVANAAK